MRRRDRRPVKRYVLLLVGVPAILISAAVWWVKVSPGLPTVEFQSAADTVGGRVSLDIVVRAPGWPGLRRIAIDLRAGGKTYALFEEEFPPVSWIGSRVESRELHFETDLSAVGVPEGPAEIEIFADTYAWRIVPARGEPVAERTVNIDLTPPRIELLSTQHNARLGGSSVAVFRVTPDTAQAGVVVENYFFPAVRGYFADPDIALAVFAVPQDLTTAAEPLVRASGVGNTREVALPCRIRGRRFVKRTLSISDGFLQRKIPDILAANNQPVPDDLLAGYLHVNRHLREQTERELRELTTSSVDVPLWDGPFHRQSNAAQTSGFADRRSYVYDGKTVDRQTHLGCDLASHQRAPVEATQNGVVVFAGSLGIYGGTVIVDHGLGVFSLYGHLSTIAVAPGQEVHTGETLGQTGETGLAGGDHLHFSIMVHGTHVDPIEWWDPKWLNDHVMAKLTAWAANVSDPPGGVATAPVSETAPDGQAQP